MSQETKRVKKKQADKEKASQKEVKSEETVKENSSNEVKDTVKLKYGPTVRFPYQRVWSRSALIFPLLFIIWYSSRQGKEIYLAKQKEILLSRSLDLECSSKYKPETSKYPECTPEKCGIVVTDKLVSGTETDVLLKLATNGFQLGEPADAGSNTLDLHSGKLSKGQQRHVEIYALPETKKTFTSADFAFYKVVRTKVQSAIAHHFGISTNKIFLTNPSFLSRATNVSEVTIDDAKNEDTQYTAILFLSDYGRDFGAGRLTFVDKNNVKTVVEPRKGRVTMFTTSNEREHKVENVYSGTRYALTLSFTCDSAAEIADPNYRVLQNK